MRRRIPGSKELPRKPGNPVINTVIAALLRQLLAIRDAIPKLRHPNRCIAGKPTDSSAERYRARRGPDVQAIADGLMADGIPAAPG